METERTYLLRVDEIQRLREQRGLSVRELAARCEVDRKTIGRWLKGGPAYMANIARLAEVLRTTADQLFVGGVSTQADAALVPVASRPPDAALATPKRGRKLTVVVFKFDDIDDEQEAEFFVKLAQAIGTTRTLEAIDLAPANSVVFTVELDPEDDERLVRAFVTGQLAPLGVTRLQDAETGEDVTGAMIDGVYFFAPDSGQNYMTLAAVKPDAQPKTAKKPEKQD